MPPIPGFCGPSYQSQSLLADAQLTCNFYVEKIESTGKLALYKTPGKKVFVNVGGQRAVRDELEISGRAFAVFENLQTQSLYEVFSNNTAVLVGALGLAGGNVTMAVNNASPAQLMITSAGRMFLSNLNTPASAPIEISTATGGAALQGAVADVRFLGPYFLARLKATQRFQLSKPLDGSTWDPNDIAQIELFPDLMRATFVDHLTYWVFSGTQGVAYSDTGNSTFPIEPYTASIVEQGIAGEKAWCKQDNSVYLLAEDKAGARILGRLDGFKLDRVSNHALEEEWRHYPIVSDVEFYSYSEAGHPFVILYFPSAPPDVVGGPLGKTWAYDISTQMFHRRQYFDGGADRARCHMSVFGKHLVGDWNSGTIYDVSIDSVDDAGTLIRRIRRVPLPHKENEYVSVSMIEVLAETGDGPTPDLLDGRGLPRPPQMGLRFSGDYGRTWGEQHFRSAGKVGEYFRRLRWLRLGRGRGIVVEIEVTDPIHWRILDGFYQAS